MFTACFSEVSFGMILTVLFSCLVAETDSGCRAFHSPLLEGPQPPSSDPHHLEESWPFPFQTPAPMPDFPYRTAVFCSELFWIAETLADPLLGLHRTDYRS